MKAIIYEGVQWDSQTSQLGTYVTLGEPPRNAQPGEQRLIIGTHAIVRSYTILYAGSHYGDYLQTGHHVMVREDNEIGHHVSLGTSSVLEYGNRIGDRCRIHSGCFLEQVTLKNDVFIGPNVVFTDDPHPICPRYKECKGGVYIGAFSRIGANSTILPGVKIGKNCLIGAGSVVTTDVPDNSVFVGNPARFVKKISELSCEPGFYERPYIWLEKENNTTGSYKNEKT